MATAAAAIATTATSRRRLEATLTSAVTGVLDFLRVGEETALESDQVARVVEETQARVERYYYELRKKLFDFDEVPATTCHLKSPPATPRLGPPDAAAAGHCRFSRRSGRQLTRGARAFSVRMPHRFARRCCSSRNKLRSASC